MPSEGAVDALSALVAYSDEPQSPEETSLQPQNLGEVSLQPAPRAGKKNEGAGAAVQERLPDGRVRAFPHVEGNYAGFIFVSVGRARGLAEAGQQAVAAASGVLAEGCKLHRVPGDDQHLSLSRTFALRRHQIEPLVQHLKSQLRTLPCFEVELAGADVLANDDRTRSFVGLKLKAGTEKMRGLVRAVDRSLTKWDVEPYYSEQRFHASVAWFAGALDQVDVKRLGDIETPTVSCAVTSVHAKIGARSYNFRLRRG
mmetsp:Transcript_54547/g.111287  ORF Transcript_54547/g.111287 Transcript_54547/m.111287 type:complete len:256 (-) Transcript_54547:53-820(-)